MATPIELIINGRDNTGGAFSSAQSGIAKIGQIAAGILTSQIFTQLANGVKDFVTSTISEAREAELAFAGLQQTLSTMGNASGLTAEQMRDLADSMEMASNFTAEEIMGAQGIMATFDRIGQETFPRASQMALDMAARFGMDLQSATVSLSKALQGTEGSLGALSKQGITFTDEQKKVIQSLFDTGHAAEAQAMIMDAISPQVDGFAASQVRAWDKVKKVFDNFKEDIGTALLPAIDKLGSTMSEVLATPEVQAAIQNLVTWLGENAPKAVDALVNGFKILKSFSGDAGKGLMEFVKPFIPAIKSVVDTLEKMRPTLEKIGAALMEHLVKAGRELGEKVFPWLVEKANQFADWFAENRPLIEDFAAALATAFGFIADVIVELWDTAEPLLDALMEAILGLAEFVMEVATGDWEGAWETIQETLENVLSLMDDAILNFLDSIANLFGSSLKEIGETWKGNWNQLKQIVSSLTTIIKNTIRSWLDDIRNAFSSVWNSIISIVTNAVNAIRNAVTSAMSAIVSAVTSAANSIRTAFQSAISAAQSAITSGLSAIRNLFSTALTGIISAVASWGSGLVSAIGNAISNAVASAGSALSGLVNLGALMIAKIIDGIRANVGRLIDYIRSIVQTVINGFLGGLGGSITAPASSKSTGFFPSSMTPSAAGVGVSGSTTNNFYQPTINIYDGNGNNKRKIMKGLI